MEAAKSFVNFQDMQVVSSVVVTLVTLAFFLSRRRAKRLSSKPGTEAPAAADEELSVEVDEEEEYENGETHDMIADLDVPADARGTFTLVEEKLNKGNKRRTQSESMVVHPGQDGSGARISEPRLSIKTTKMTKGSGEKSERQKIMELLEPGESLLKKGLIVRKKYKGLLPSIRVMCLTDNIRLLEFDPKTYKVKGCIELQPKYQLQKPEVTLLEEKKFSIKTKDKIKGFKETVIYSERAGSWVEEITKVLQPESFAS